MSPFLTQNVFQRSPKRAQEAFKSLPRRWAHVGPLAEKNTGGGRNFVPRRRNFGVRSILLGKKYGPGTPGQLKLRPPRHSCHWKWAVRFQNLPQMIQVRVCHESFLDEVRCPLLPLVVCKWSEANRGLRALKSRTAGLKIPAKALCA